MPSPTVATYDLKPEMSAPQVADAVVEALSNQRYGFILVGLWWGGFGLIVFSLLHERPPGGERPVEGAAGRGVLGDLATASITRFYTTELLRFFQAV